MPNVASVLKSEITRISRKEVRAEVEGLKKAVSLHRTEIAALKRRLRLLEQSLGHREKSGPKQARAASTEPSAPAQFSAKDLALQRKRLGLTMDSCAVLLGTAGKSIYRWEHGKAQPRQSYWASLAALRTLSAEQAAEIVAGRK
jgi:DNA-binding transcriptional regulator YiaG